MRILVNLENTDDFRDIYIEENESIESLKYILEAEFNVPYIEQEIKYESMLLEDPKLVRDYKIKEEKIVILTKRKLLPFNFGGNLNIGGRSITSNVNNNLNNNNNFNNNSISQMFDNAMKNLKSNPVPKNNQPLANFNPNHFLDLFNIDTKVKAESKNLKEFYLSKSDELNYLFMQDPDLAEIIVSGDDKRLEEIVKKRMTENMNKKRKELDEYNRLLSADPNDQEAQKKIEEMIKWKNIDENLKMAQEYLPESFSHIHMLYINLEINKHQIVALVDTGAQMTIISENLAKKCGIFNLCDTRYQGIAKGVGTSKIIGVIHAAQMKIGNKYIYFLLFLDLLCVSLLC